MNGRHHQNATRVWLARLALSLPSVLAQPGPPAPPGGALLQSLPGTPPPPPAERPSHLPPSGRYTGDYRAIEEAAKALEKAVRKAYEVEYIAALDTQHIPYQAALGGLGRELLEQAEADFSAQTYFAARERAKAAGDVYKILEHLYAAEGSYAASAPLRGRRAPPSGRGPRGADLTYRVQEDLYVLERELDYYRVADAGVNQLYTVAQELLLRLTWTPLNTATCT